jgi:hypothetical protein
VPPQRPQWTLSLCPREMGPPTRSASARAPPRDSGAAPPIQASTPLAPRRASTACRASRRTPSGLARGGWADWRVSARSACAKIAPRNAGRQSSPNHCSHDHLFA